MTCCPVLIGPNEGGRAPVHRRRQVSEHPVCTCLARCCATQLLPLRVTSPRKLLALVTDLKGASYAASHTVRSPVVGTNILSCTASPIVIRRLHLQQ
ncbi:hypothetical protein BaRGS_00020017 [Batillaria attramentaria]|uniref:Uncharacterized protein n=1 Tax=Batillaria attramentaria TaxID=370345 RepID=A0ABD0KNV9_9CAEN